jgi:hypothetical protein
VTATVADLRTIADVAREADVSWWSARALVRTRYEDRLIRLADRWFLAAEDAAAVVADLKARKRQGAAQ